jgi:hypothetical protein
MRTATGVLPALALGVAWILKTTSPSFAITINYTEEVTGSGSIIGDEFTNGDVVISVLADTANVVDGGHNNFTVVGNPTGVGVAVNGGFAPPLHGVGYCCGSTSQTVFSSPQAIGFQSFLSTDLSTTSPAYDLRTPIGPLSGGAVISGTGPFGPAFILSSVTGPSTFTATAVGDPHFTTYDGVHYDFQGIGDFVLTRSTVAGDQFDVQILTRAWNNGTSLIESAVATLCNHDVTFEAGAGGGLIRLDGAPVTLSAGGPALTAGGCKILEPSSGEYQVVWDTGEMLDLTNNVSNDDVFYLNVSSQLSWIDGLSSMEGLLSSDLNPDAWRVTGVDSLFDPVPEPGTLTLLASALAGLGIIRRRAGRS